MVQVHVDPATCYATGIDIVVDENHTHVEDFFFDNVGMKGDANWRQLGGGGDEFEYEIQDPRTKRFRPLRENLTEHRFEVGVAVVEVIGYDYAGNQHSCLRTVIVCDTPDEACARKEEVQSPSFSRPAHVAQISHHHLTYVRAPAPAQNRDLSDLVRDARTHGHAHEPLMMQYAPRTPSRSPKSLLSFRRAHKTGWFDWRPPVDQS